MKGRIGRVYWRSGGFGDDFLCFNVVQTCAPERRGRSTQEYITHSTERRQWFRFRGRRLLIRLVTINYGTRWPDSWNLDFDFWKKNWKPSKMFIGGDGKGGLKFTSISENGANEINLSAESTGKLLDRLDG